MANILFVNPPSPDGYVYIRDTNRSGRRSMERTIWPQTSLAMLAAVFPDDNCKVLDCIAEEISYVKLYDLMKEFAPDWVVFNPISSIFVHDMIVAHYAKSLGAKTVVISPHTKALKEESYERYKSIDHAVDYTKRGEEPEDRLHFLIKGFPRDGSGFESLPPARQNMLPISKYNLPFIGRGYTFVITSRGCPWKCIYCRQTVMYESQVRFRPVQTVIEEIQKYHLTNIALHADTATMNRAWIMQFCDELDKLPFKVRIVTNSRVDTVDLEMLQRMRRSGFWMICFGIESGDNDVLRLNKKETTVEQAKLAVVWAKQAGFKVWGYFMLGMFGDTEKTMDRTLRLANALPLDIANFAVSAPYPGTEWNKICRENQWFDEGSEEAFDQNYSAQISQPNCPSRLVKKMQRKAYLSWYLSWRGLKFLVSGLLNGSPSYFYKTIRDHLR